MDQILTLYEVYPLALFMQPPPWFTCQDLLATLWLQGDAWADKQQKNPTSKYSSIVGIVYHSKNKLFGQAHMD